MDKSNDLLNRNPIAQDIRTRIDKCDCIKLKSFCTPEETIARMKKHTTEWEKIFTSYSLHKGLISRICKEVKN
jgi:hypothetical protein